MPRSIPATHLWLLHPGLLCCLGFVPCALRAQADGAATQGIRLQVYGLASYVRPDFGGALKNAGGTIGGTVNAFTLYPVELGLDVRAVGSGGRVSEEFFYGAGPRAQLDLGRLQPFAAVHFGYGKIDFQYPPTPAYTHDNSTVVAYGGGLDVRTSSRWALRAEVERQGWRLSSTSPSFHPLAISVGLRYQFRFRAKAGTE